MSEFVKVNIIHEPPSEPKPIKVNIIHEPPSEPKPIDLSRFNIKSE